MRVENTWQTLSAYTHFVLQRLTEAGAAVIPGMALNDMRQNLNKLSRCGSGHMDAWTTEAMSVHDETPKCWFLWLGRGMDFVAEVALSLNPTGAYEKTLALHHNTITRFCVRRALSAQSAAPIASLFTKAEWREIRTKARVVSALCRVAQKVNTPS